MLENKIGQAQPVIQAEANLRHEQLPDVDRQRAVEEANTLAAKTEPSAVDADLENLLPDLDTLDESSFSLPREGGPVPNDSLGGGTRLVSQVQFEPPGDLAPKDSVGSGSRFTSSQNNIEV